MLNRVNKKIHVVVKSILKFDTLSDLQKKWGLPKAWVKTLFLAVRLVLKNEMMSVHIPALTFSTVMAIVPLFAMLFVVARGFGYDQVIETWILELFEAQPMIGTTMVEFVHNYLKNTESQYIFGVSLLMMFYTLIALMQKIELVFNMIWHAEERTLTRRITDYTLLFILFSVMVLSSSLVNVSTTAFLERLDSFMGWRESFSLALRYAAVIPMTLFFVVLYNLIPNTRVKISCTLVPALLSGVLMLLLQYYYVLAQVWLSSYNIIYGSFAALPLFLLWAQISWAICLFGAVLTYTNQNLHHFDGDCVHQDLSHEAKIQVCAIIMGHVCRQFQRGGAAYTAVDIHRLTRIPQQIVNASLYWMKEAGLLIGVKTEGSGLEEETTRILPIEDISNLTCGVLLERLETCGKSLESIDTRGWNVSEWENLYKIRHTFLKESSSTKLCDLVNQSTSVAP